jgi:hypothetical protein
VLKACGCRGQARRNLVSFLSLGRRPVLLSSCFWGAWFYRRQRIFIWFESVFWISDQCRVWTTVLLKILLLRVPWWLPHTYCPRHCWLFLRGRLSGYKVTLLARLSLQHTAVSVQYMQETDLDIDGDSALSTAFVGRSWAMP